MACKNVFLAAMSTLPLMEPKETEFTYEEQGNEIKIAECISQLEPILKLALNIKENENWTVVLLCTSATKSDKNNFAGKSATEYLKERIAAYLYYKKIKIKEPEYVEIDINEKDAMEGIHGAVDYIRNVENRGELWIDTHGGFRDISLVIESIISILKPYGIVPERVLGVQYGSDSKKIVDQRRAYDMFDFVSGINEFLEYGSVSLLAGYYDKRKKSKKVDALLKAMQIVSDGLKECDPQKYDVGIKKLKRALVIESGEDEHQMKIFEECIKNDYGDILSDDMSMIHTIKRCFDKGMYQQALTFLESRMPEEFVLRGLIYCEQSEFDKFADVRDTDRHFERYLDVYQNLFGAFMAKGRFFDYRNESALNDYIESGNTNGEGYCRLRRIKNGISLSYKNVAIQLKSNVSDDKRDLLDKLLHLHKALKTCRNYLNHSNPERPSMERIRARGYEYVDIAIRLFKQYKKDTHYMLSDNALNKGSNSNESFGTRIDMSGIRLQ